LSGFVQAAGSDASGSLSLTSASATVSGIDSQTQQQLTNDLNTAATGSTTTSSAVTWLASLSSDAANWSWSYTRCG
jgi:hypothetical protein